MRRILKFLVWVVLILVGICLFVVVILRSVFIASPMTSDSMQPLIASKDIVLATKWFHAASLHTGDLVVVYIPTKAGQVLTVRKIEQQPETPAGLFYLSASSTNGIDSRQFGAVQASNILGRVVWIIKGN